MARKARDYKAEYRRSKERARKAGYRSPYELKKTRKLYGLKGSKVSPVPKRVLREIEKRDVRTTDANRIAAREWSRAHSRQLESRYGGGFSDERVMDYLAAFVLPQYDDRSKRYAIWQYKTRWMGLTEPWTETWVSNSKR